MVNNITFNGSIYIPLRQAEVANSIHQTLSRSFFVEGAGYVEPNTVKGSRSTLDSHHF